MWHHWHGVRRIFGILLSGTIICWGALAHISPFYEPFIPAMIEWPVGCSGDIVQLPDGGKVVLHTRSRRIQIYDRQWHFVRGWRIADDNPGKFFEMRLNAENSIEVQVTYPYHLLVVYALDGRLLDESSYDPQDRANVWSVKSSSRECVPTALPLWPFTNGFFSFITTNAGLIILYVSVLSEKTRYDGTRR
jgi:hypothetical protein